MTLLDQLKSEFLTEEQLAELLRVNVRTLRNWHSAGKGPRRSHHRPILYAEEEVRRWLKTGKKAS